ncbi:MAG: hypothetical protein JJW01_01960 [Alphaproteobacteria bacterium]|nr:hypothetical protein [Rickettsiales bacterium]
MRFFTAPLFIAVMLCLAFALNSCSPSKHVNELYVSNICKSQDKSDVVPWVGNPYIFHDTVSDKGIFFVGRSAGVANAAFQPFIAAENDARFQFNDNLRRLVIVATGETVRDSGYPKIAKMYFYSRIKRSVTVSGLHSLILSFVKMFDVFYSCDKNIIHVRSGVLFEQLKPDLCGILFRHAHLLDVELSIDDVGKIADLFMSNLSRIALELQNYGSLPSITVKDVEMGFTVKDGKISKKQL